MPQLYFVLVPTQNKSLQELVACFKKLGEKFPKDIKRKVSLQNVEIVEQPPEKAVLNSKKPGFKLFAPSSS